MGPTITDGVFFRTPPALPRGRHSVEREVIVAAQRERLLIAAVELTAAEGFRGFGIRELCRAASVSQSVFYEHFADKDECVFGVYRRFIEVIVTRMRSAAAVETTWDHYLETFVATYFEALNLDRLVARASIVEMDALGRTGRALRRDSIRGIAVVLHDAWHQLNPDRADDLSLTAVVAVTNMARQAAVDSLDATPDADLRDLIPIVAPLVIRALTP